MPIDILWPTFALVALVAVVMLTMFVQRIGHIRRNPPGAGDFASGEAALRYFQPVEMPANNFRNLFEMPVLFFALVPLLLITHHGNHIQVTLAWIYVALRALHSFIHIVVRNVNLRFMLYLGSCVVLMAMWIGFAADIAAAR
ncbi:MAPEG family protein [Sphingomonas sp. JC676]|uniref:MAPEG family protein n=1 Tax=Sphingomonas sp. JC676 TaxID=2768065 RepID=UPI001658451B|nr:MAPEG family protein [Sphingomonas sp. JC676]MBC9033577.1 MAPEG family protein [Sphingomonas sp. JC676]